MESAFSPSESTQQFKDERPEAGVQRRMQHGANSSSQVQQLQTLQRAINLGNSPSTLQAPVQRQTASVVQRTPGDLDGIVTPDIQEAPGGMFSSRSTWGQIQDKVTAYVALDSDNISGRNTAVKALEPLVTTWLQQFGVKEEAFRNDPTNNSISQKEFKQKIAVQQIKAALVKEKKEIAATSGSLGIMKGDVIDDPRITGQIKSEDKSAPKGGMFKEDTDILDKSKTKIGTGQKGKVVKIIGEWDDSDTTVKKGDHDKISKEDQTKAGDNYQAVPDGYVEKDTLIGVNRVDNVDNSAHMDRKNPMTYPLFPHPARVEDVQQGGIGDCYLIASMATVAAKKPGHFERHMKDHGDGTVTILLYDSKGSAVSVTVKKTIASTNNTFSANKDLYANGPMWVKMYEKAYVAAGFQGKEDDLTSESQSYGMIEGGWGSTALKHITGENTEQASIDTGRSAANGVIANYINRTIIPDLNTDDPDHEDFQTLLKLSGQVVPELGDLMAKTFVTQSDLRKMLNDKGLPAGIVTKVMNYVVQEQILTGDLGSGVYTKGELSLFDKIKGKIDAGKLVTMGTNQEIFDSKDEIEGKGGSAGEPMVKGLVGGHEYSVLDYAPKNPLPGATLSILVRNPWGTYGRKYQKADDSMADLTTGATYTGAKRVKDSSGQFWMDLADLAAYGNQLSFTK